MQHTSCFPNFANNIKLNRFLKILDEEDFDDNLNYLANTSNGEFIAFVHDDYAWFYDEDSLDKALEIFNYRKVGGNYSDSRKEEYRFVYTNDSFVNSPLLVNATITNFKITQRDAKTGEIREIKFLEGLKISSIEEVNGVYTKFLNTKMFEALNYTNLNKFFEITTSTFKAIEEFDRIAKNLYR